MPATTLKLPVELKQRIAALVQGTGQSMHAFMVRAIEDEVKRAVERRSFHESALLARDDALRTGLAHPAEAVHDYIRTRLTGKRARRPRARSWHE